LFVAALALAGCGASQDADPPPAERPDVSTWMRSHFLQGRAIRDALAAGEVGAARTRLGQVSERPGPRGAPAAWEAPLAELREAAAEAAEADELGEMTRAFAAYAARCADCHRASEAVATFEAAELPPVPPTAPALMLRHQWAAERMWEGLVGPVPARYREGARVLAEAPLHQGELVVGRAPPLEVVRVAERTRELAAAAARAETQAERAELYGELLSTCAACHSQLPEPQPY
jgi:cytochrome c553